MWHFGSLTPRVVLNLIKPYSWERTGNSGQLCLTQALDATRV